MNCCLRYFASVKFLLFASFAVLMGLSGFLGYFFVSTQNEKSINDAAERCALDIVDGVTLFVQDRIEIGHRLNLAESYYFLERNLTLDNWYNVHYLWRPMVLENLLPLAGLYSLASVNWMPMFYLTVNPLLSAYFYGDFNCTVCNDTVNFPGSNCSVHWAEVYPMYGHRIIWDQPIALNVYFDQRTTTYWKAGPIVRTGPGWRSTPADRFRPGYAPIFPFLDTDPPMLNLQINLCNLNANGECVGSMFRSLLLRFLGEHLKNLTASHKLLINNGRLFCYETGNKLITGASHGGVYFMNGPKIIVRFNASRSPDPIIAAAGAKLLADPNRLPTAQAKEFFEVNGESFICFGKPFHDEYGLSWMVAIVLSLSDLFKDISRNTKIQASLTIVAIVLLSIFGSALVSLALMYPLKHLKREMRSIAQLDFDKIDVQRRSIFYEIAGIQSLFASMVRNLKLYKPFLPDAIIPTPPMTPRENDPLNASGRSSSIAGSRRQVMSGSRLSSSILPHELSPGSHKSSSPALPRRVVVSSTEGFEIPAGSNPTQEQQQPEQQPVTRRATFGWQDAPAPAPDFPSPVDNSKPTNDMSGVGAMTSPTFKPLANTLTSRTTSILQIDFRFVHLSIQENEMTLRDLHTNIIGFATKTVSEQNGHCGSPFGDKLMGFWNLRRMRTDHPMLCASAALMVHQYVHNLKIENPAFDFGVGLVCTSGSCLFGSMGQSTRSFTVFSRAIQTGFLMQKLSRILPVKILCDSTVYNMAKVVCKARLVAVLPIQTSDIEVFELVERVSGRETDSGAADDDEHNWMRQDKENKNFTVAVQQLFHKEHQSACGKHLRAHLEIHGNSDPLARWFYQNYSDLCQMSHPSYGFTLPVNLLYPIEFRASEP